MQDEDKSKEQLVADLASLQRHIQELEAEVDFQEKAGYEIQRYSKRLRVLHDIDHGILAAHSIAEIAEVALANIRQLVSYRRGSVVLYDLEANEGYLLALSFDGDTRLAKGLYFSLDNSTSMVYMRQGKIYAIEDLSTQTNLTQADRQLLAEGIRSYLRLPLIAQNELIGSFNLGAATPNAFTPEQSEIAIEVANQLAIAIQQARLREAETRRRREAEMLREATVALTTALDLDQVLDSLLRHLAAVIPYDSACVFLREGKRLKAVAGRGFLMPEQVLNQYYPIEDDLLFQEIRRTGRPLILDDAQTDPRFLSWGDTAYIHGWMGVPLKVGRDVIGHLTLDNRQPASYGEAEAALAQAFANQAAIAIENARLFETEQYQRKIAETLGEVAKVVSSSLELEEVLDRVLLELEKVTQYDGAMITFLEQDITYLAAARGFSNLNVTLVPSLPLNRLVISQKAIQARQTIVVPDIHQELNLDTTLPGTSKARCMIVAPLFSREEIIGLLSFVSTTPARYSERDAEIATQFAQHAAIAIENARLYEAERHQRQMAELLLDTSAAVVSSLDPSQVLLTLASRLREISDFHTCILYGWQPGKDYIHELANHTRSIWPPEGGNRYRVADYPTIERVLSRGEPVITHQDMAAIDDAQLAFLQAVGLATVLTLPVFAGEEIIGLADIGNIFDKPGFDETSVAGCQEVLRKAAQELVSPLSANSGDKLLSLSGRLIEISGGCECAFSAWFPGEGEIRTAAIYADFVRPRSEGLVRHLADYPNFVQAIETGEPVVTWLDTQPLSASTQPPIARWYPLTSVVLPLVVHGRTIGLAELNHFSEARSIDDETLRFWRAVTDQASIAIENARLYTEAEQRAEYLAILRELDQAITASLHIDDVYDALAQQTLRLLSYDHLSIILLEGDDNLRVTYTAGPVPLFSVGALIRLGDLQPISLAIGQGQPILTADTTTETRFVLRQQTIEAGIRSGMIIPLRIKGRIIGAWTLARRQVGGYTGDNLAIAQLMADQLSIAIENAQLYEQLEQHTEELEQRIIDRTRELSVMYEVAAVASEALDLQTTLARSLDQVLRAMKSSAGIIHLLDRANKQLKLAAQQGLPPDFVAQIENVPSNRGLGKRLIEAGEPLFVTDITSDSRMAEVAYTGSPQVYVGLPIRAQGRVVGVLSIIRQVDQPQYNVEEVTLLRSIADQVGVVVQSARLRERVEQAAIIEERTRLARDLHDSVTQSLYGATLFADAGKELIKANDLARASEYMSRTGEVIQTALKEMRLLIYELRPAMLEQVGLVGALRQRLETVERRANISVGLTAGESINLPMTVEQELYHIAQEALNNALKHAEATSVTVSLTGNETQVFLEVSDNGRGFDYETARQQGGLGLITMRERAEKIDGKLEIATAPDKGTQVKVIVASDLSASRLNGE